MKTDEKIYHDILQELKADPSITHEHIGIAVENGIVNLTGTVPTYVEKWSAEKAAQRVQGVRAVVEKIEVKLPDSLERDDNSLAKAIVDQMKWAVRVPDKSIKVAVEKGWVTLSGEVEWDFQRKATVKCVRGLTGVRGITNYISIKEKQVEPAVIKKRIEEALMREVQREARRISVDVKGSTVTLNGEVHSFTESWDARGAAMSAPGVTSVVNNLQISY